MTKKRKPANQAAFAMLVRKYGKARIAEFAGVSLQALTKWNSVPLPRVPAIAKATGLPPEKILPDPYSPE